MTRQLYSLLHALANLASASVPAPGAAQPRASPEAQCTTVVLWLRLTLALLAPLLYSALSEARLWQRHQRERAAAGLPPEPVSSPRAAVYRAARWLAWKEGDSTAHAAGLCWLLLAAAWDWCTFLLVPAGTGGGSGVAAGGKRAAV